MVERRISMEFANVRISKITLKNFKSVAFGEINLSTTDSLRAGTASVVGIYGQNASGKTVVVEALSIVKHAMSGEQIPSHYLDCIAHGKDECVIEVEFIVAHTVDGFDLLAIYAFTLSRRNDPNSLEDNPRAIIAITSEVLRFRGVVGGDRDYILQDIARTDESCHLIQPANKCKLLFGTDTQVLKDLENQKVLALFGSRSFIFSRQTIQASRKNADSTGEMQNILLVTLVMRLHIFAQAQLFVINEQSVRHNLHIFQTGSVIKVPIRVPVLLRNLNGVPLSQVNEIETLLPNLNNVLCSLVPGLKLEVEYEKNSVRSDSYIVEIFSCREGLGRFPFKSESLGIKKIVSFIVLLIEAYNNPSFTLVIDELDSGVFEYLLGEILDIMKRFGKGQLIFTSHNLCPLEKLDAHNVWFSTTDPTSRYVQMTKKATNNLRNMYLRAIHLGYNDNELYNGESKSTLSHAFRKMGRNE